MTPQEQALEWVEEQRVQYNRVGNHYVQDVLKLCKQALQSQAEKDRVMVLMSEALKPFANTGNYWVSSENRNSKDIFISENKENSLGQFQYRKRANHDAEQALSEYAKLGGTQDE